MNAEFLIRTLRENNIGLSISPEGKLILDGDGAIIKRYLETVKEHKPAILTLLQSEKPVELIRDGNGFFDMEAFIYDQNIKAVFMDTETTGLDPFSANLVLVQISAGGKTFIIDACAIPEHQRPFFYSGIKRILEDDGIIKVFHNALFDLKFLQKRVFQNDRLQVKNLFDTMLAEQLLTAGISQRGEHSLKAVCKKYLNIELDKSQQTSFKAGQPLTQAQISYAAADVHHLEPVFRIQAAAIAKENLTDIALMEFAIIPAIVNMELTGIHFDLTGLETMKARLHQDEKRLEAEAFHCNEPAQRIPQEVYPYESEEPTHPFGERGVRFRFKQHGQRAIPPCPANELRGKPIRALPAILSQKRTVFLRDPQVSPC